MQSNYDVLIALEEAFCVMYDNSNKFQDLQHEGCLVICVLEQMMVRILLKRLMQVMMIEAVIEKRNAVPLSYIYNYLKFQTHFSLKETITDYYMAYQHTMRYVNICLQI